MKYRHIFTTAGFVKHAKKKAENKDGDLAEASKELVKEIVVGKLLYYGIYVVVCIGILAVFGFTDWLGGPFVLAQVVLFLVVGTILLATVGLWWLWRKIKQRVRKIGESHRNQAQRHQATDTTIIEGKLSDNE